MLSSSWPMFPPSMVFLTNEPEICLYSWGEIGLVSNVAVNITFTRLVDSANFLAGVTIRKNGGAAEAMVSGTLQVDEHIVRYILAAPVAFGDVLTFAYSQATGLIKDHITTKAIAEVAAVIIMNNLPGVPPGMAMGVLGLTYP
jgi:hypothetical protein